MAKIDQRWAQLRQLMELVSDLELVKLSKLSAEVTARKAVSDGLRLRKLADIRKFQSKNEPDAAQKSGADMKWVLWLETEIKNQNTALAQKRGEYEAQSVNAQRAFGRALSVNSVSKMLRDR